MNFLQKRKERKKIERKIQARQGKKNIERHIKKQRANLAKYWELGKRSARIKDGASFKQISAFILATQRDITQWERRLLYFDMVEARQDQVLAAADFAQSYQAMAKTMLAHSDPANIAQIQQDIEMGMARAEMMDGMLENLMDMSEDMLTDEIASPNDAELTQIMSAIQTEADEEGFGLGDDEIEASLRAIEEQLGR